MNAPQTIWVEPALAREFARPVDDPTEINYTRTDLSQASVAAALEAAAKEHDAEIVRLEAQIIENNKYLRLVGKSERSSSNDFCNTAIGHHRGSAVRLRDLITQAQHNALAAHVAAEVAKARAEDAAWLPVEDAPQDGTAVITIKSNGDVARGAWYQNPFGDENTFIDRASGKWWTAVGWLPMPKAIAQIGANP